MPIRVSVPLRGIQCDWASNTLSTDRQMLSQVPPATTRSDAASRWRMSHFLWHVFPGTAGLEHIEDTVECLAVIGLFTSGARFLGWDKWRNDRPLFVGQFMSAHAPSLVSAASILKWLLLTQHLARRSRGIHRQISIRQPSACNCREINRYEQVGRAAHRTQDRLYRRR